MKRIVFRISIVLILLAAALVCSCTEEPTPEEEASRIIGLPIPAPEYLPEGYTITSVNATCPGHQRELWTIRTKIDNANTGDSMTLFIDWMPFLDKFRDDDPYIEVNGNRISYFVADDFSRVRWNDSESRMLVLTAPPDFPFEELTMIVASVTTPPARILGVSLEPEGSNLQVTRGTTKRLALHLRNNSLEKIKVNCSGPGTVAEGITVTLEDDSFTMKPGEERDISIAITVSDDAVSPAWLHRSFEETAPEDWPPEHRYGTPFYRLGFDCTYERGGETFDCLSSLTRFLRIDVPEPLPAGMLTLEEIREVVSYPVDILLPSYLPENIDPPKWYEKIGDAPCTVIAHYDGMTFVMEPEPGITEPPDSSAGERALIRNRPVVIGENRIDWWYYGLHFSLVSDTVPIKELLLSAKSTMMADFNSDGWFSSANN